MKKFIIALCIHISPQISFAQKDSTVLEIFGERNDSIQKPTLFLHISFISNSSQPLTIISETFATEFYCGLGGAVGLHIQKLEEFCFKDLSPDCNPIYPPIIKKSKQINFGDTVSYKFDIGIFLDKKMYNNRVLKFKGVYRVKVYHNYTSKNNETPLIESKWMYLTF